MRRGSAPPSASFGEIISEEEILKSAVTATQGGYLAVGTGHMIGIRKNSQPDLRKTPHNSHVGRGKTHEKSGGVSFLGLNVGKTKNRSSSVPRGKYLAHKYYKVSLSSYTRMITIYIVVTYFSFHYDV